MNTFKSHLKGHMTLTLFVALLVLGLSGVALHNITSANDSDGAPPPEKNRVPSVEVVTIEPQSIRIWSKFSGRLRAVDYVEVRPRVGGTITQVLFEEGAIVKKGDPLFVIDPRTFEAEFRSAQAALETAQSQTTLAKSELKRAKGLVQKKVISQSRFDSTKNEYQVAMASINTAKARMKQAALDLEFAHIKAPISGRISRAEITEGNVIESGLTAPILTTIVSVDQLYAEFDVDEQTYMKTRRSTAGGAMPVELTLTSDTSAVFRGVIHSFDNQLNTTSGTIRARAIFDNEDRALVPGMFVTVHLGSSGEQSILLVSDRAVRTDQEKKYVYVITPDSKVAYREVKLGRTLEGQRVVLSGLTSGDQVMMNSLQRVRPEMEVQPVELTLN